MSCVQRKLGHNPKRKIERNFNNVSNLLKTTRKLEIANNVNLVIDKPLFLIGGAQEPYDQGQLGSCTANALAFAFVYNCVKQGYTPFMPSRLDIYYNERVNMGMDGIMNDDGANISDCEYVLENVGMIPEKSWPYCDDYLNPLYYTIPNEGKDDVRTLAMSQNTMYTVDPVNLNAIKLTLTNGYPLVAGILVDMDVFCSETTTYTGIITKIPNIRRGNLGGHAVVIVGYTSDGYFLVRNSWGVNWGLGFLNKSNGVYNYDEYNGKMRGYFKVPFSYITNPLITSELYAVAEINNTLNTINSTGYSINLSLDKSFSPDATIKPLGTYFTSLIIKSSRLKIDFYYSFNTLKNKYIWYIRTLRTMGINNQTTSVVSDCEVTNLNFIDNITIGFFNKGKIISSYVLGASIAIGRNGKISSVLALNVSSGKILITSSRNI